MAHVGTSLLRLLGVRREEIDDDDDDDDADDG
jgi:hypothetical protein